MKQASPPTEVTPRRGGLSGLGVSSERLQQAFSWTQQTEVSIEVAIAINSSIWFARVETFREMEETMPAGEFDKYILDRRSALSTLINEGETIVYAAKRAGLGKLPPGFTVADLEATLETLHIAFKAQHRNGNTHAVNAAVERLLNVA